MTVKVPTIGPTPETVADAIGSMVESMYFREAVYSGSTVLPGPAVSAGLAFSGPVKGEFRVALAPGLATELTADFLVSEPDEVTQEQIQATAREFTNIGCGSVLSAWMPDADFEFETPHDGANFETHGSRVHAFALRGELPDLAVEIRLDRPDHSRRKAGFFSVAVARRIGSDEPASENLRAGLNFRTDPADRQCAGQSDPTEPRQQRKERK